MSESVFGDIPPTVGSVMSNAGSVHGQNKDLTLHQLQRQAAARAEEAGWNSPPPTFTDMAALLHSEVSEAVESYRNREKIFWYGPDGKPEGIAAEFADVVIRIAHYAELLGFSLDYAVREKMAYNATRPHRHGDKLI